MESVEIKGVLVPKTGILRKKEVAALFNRHPASIMRWVSQGLLPKPLNDSPQFKGKLGPTSPVLWDAAEVWEAYDRLRGAA